MSHPRNVGGGNFCPHLQPTKVNVSNDHASTSVMFVWLPQFSASASMKIVVVRFVDANAVLIADADFFGDRREDAAFRRHSTNVNKTNKSLLKKLTLDL